MLVILGSSSSSEMLVILGRADGFPKSEGRADGFPKSEGRADGFPKSEGRAEGFPKSEGRADGFPKSEGQLFHTMQMTQLSNDHLHYQIQSITVHCPNPI